MAHVTGFARSALLILSLTLSAPAVAQQAPQPSLQDRVAARLAQAPTGTRFGLVVVDESGRELIAINPDMRFMPASNTKLFTTAAGFATLPALDQPDATGGAAVRLEGRDVVLVGNGDARLSSAADCTTDCLATLADAVAARTRRVQDVIGDDTLYPDQRWSPGMSWNNISSAYGTSPSALTLDDNELRLRVMPGGAAGQAPTFEPIPYYRIDNQATTVAEGRTQLNVTRLPNSFELRLTGRIAVGAQPENIRLGIDDPAHYAATRLRTLLEARGVRVSGEVRVRHRPADVAPSTTPEPAPLARLTPPPLTEDMTRINKESQNLHAELMLRRVSRLRGTGSIDDGVAAVEAMLQQAGAPRTGWDLSDGSGMSTYNRVSPRTGIALLRWAARQPWGATWRDTFPIGGVDGTLANRFRGTSLERRLFAKTGTINATNALSGYMIGRSGRTLTFSMFANDVPGGASATATMDAVLVAIAEAN